MSIKKLLQNDGILLTNVIRIKHNINIKAAPKKSNISHLITNKPNKSSLKND